jgi:hypothetical protein
MQKSNVLLLAMTVVLVGFVALLASTVAHGEGSGRGTVAEIKAAVTYFVEREPHQLSGNTEMIDEIARAIVKASEKYGVDAYLLTSMASFESGFRPVVLSLKKKGKRGEKGLLQCGPDCARTCPHFLDTIEGQALCGARWLKQSYRDCGDGATDRAALAMYATGRTCETKGDSHLTWVVNRRLTRRDRFANMSK